MIKPRGCYWRELPRHLLRSLYIRFTRMYREFRAECKEARGDNG